MPIVLTLHKARSPADRQRETRTLEQGRLTIGRGSANDWILQDPEQYLSKNHCVVAVERGGYTLTDISSNGVFVNGSPTRMPKDSKVSIADGDEFLIGDYLIRVSEVAALSSRAVTESAALPMRNTPAPIVEDDPFGLDEFIKPTRPPAPPPRAAEPPPPRAPRFDPFGPDPNRRDDPFGDDGDDLLGAKPPPADRPFGEPPPPLPAMRSRDPFDAGGNKPADPFGEDLFSGKAPAEHWSGPSQPDHADAAAQALRPPKLAPLPNLDDWDDLLGDTPPGLPEPAAPRVLLPADDDEKTLHTGPLAAPPPPPAPVAVPPPRPAAPVVAPPEPAPAAANPAADRLLAAFLDGAGVPRLDIKTDDLEAYFRMVGELFGMMVESVRDVLMSRAEIKGEFGVERTMLRARNNNALKFSVTPADAVTALLQPGRPGYMPPAQATREAFDDIRSHQVAVLAGVQAALFHLLRTFDPAELEKRLQKTSRLQGLLSGGRQAKLWEAFVATYKDIARDADSDFQEVFGREFARAYNEQSRAAGTSG